MWECPVAHTDDPYAAWLSAESEATGVWINGRMVLERASVFD